MRVRPLAVAIAIALAGCSGGGDHAATAASGSSTSSSGAPSVPGTPLAPTTQALDWEDDLVLGAWVCDNTVTDDCQWQPDGAFGQSHQFEGLVGNATSGELRLEWTPATP